MYNYPKSIVAAAKLLDELNPKWVNYIKLDDLDMYDRNDCILGQLYGCHTKAMLMLFNIDVEPDFDGYSDDLVFGSSASLESWKRLIQERKQKYFLDLSTGQKFKFDEPSWDIYTIYTKCNGSFCRVEDLVSDISKLSKPNPRVKVIQCQD